MEPQSPAFKAVREQFLTARIIAWTMIASVVVYGMLAFFLIQSGSMPRGMPPIPPILRTLLYAIAILEQAAVPWIPRFVRVPDTQGKAPDTLVAGTLKLRLILRLALAESVAIFGLLLFFLTGKLTDLAILGAASMLLLIMRLPTRQEWAQASREAGLDWALD